MSATIDLMIAADELALTAVGRLTRPDSVLGKRPLQRCRE
jgi:hypothetical protein